jgi:hypothetical protein
LGRQELVQQVAVRGVDFQNLEPGCEGAPRGRLERVDDAVDAGFVERDGCRIARLERDRAGRHYRPAALLGRF